MTGLIVIDESCDLGPNGTEYFAMAALVLLRARHLKPASKLLNKENLENKWHNSNMKEKMAMLETMDQCDFSAVYSVINRNNPKSGKVEYGNKLYEKMVRQVIADALSALPCKDVNVYLDRNKFIKESRFIEIVKEECLKSGANLKSCGMKGSQSNPCIQLVDYVAGASFAESEHNDKLIRIINDKISVARRH